MTDNVIQPRIRWQRRVIISARRQRRTGKTIWRALRIEPYGPVYIDFTDPMHVAEHAFRMLRSGAIVEWQE